MHRSELKMLYVCMYVRVCMCVIQDPAIVFGQAPGYKVCPLEHAYTYAH